MVGGGLYIAGLGIQCSGWAGHKMWEGHHMADWLVSGWAMVWWW